MTTRGKRAQEDAPGTTIQSLIAQLRTAQADHGPHRELMRVVANQLEDMQRRQAAASDARGMVELSVASLVSARNSAPMVELGIGSTRLQVSIEAARAHALAILEAAEAAETDRVLLAFVLEHLDLALPQAGQLIGKFRSYREQRRGRKAGSA